MECCKDGDWVAVEDYESAEKQKDSALKEVERLKAERDEAWDRVDNLEGVIRDNIPYAYDQGEQDEDEANPEECVEYAAKEIADLKKANERLRGIVEVNDRRLAAVWDEARAEVERLKGKLMEEARWVYDTGQRAKDAQAEVERLSAVVQQVHALAATEEQDYRCVRVVENLREIHKITKGMVE
jgi:hypothetical protein